MALVNILNKKHSSTKRNYIERMNNDKVEAMKIASKYEEDYWDGDRKYGYGGYVYNGSWKPIADKLIERYQLTAESKILDVGCGMGHLLYEIKEKLGCEILGLDNSDYVMKKSPIKDYINKVDLREGLLLNDKKFDLVLSIMTLHNFEIQENKKIISEISKLSLNSYIAVESYRNASELFNLQCWALTCQSFLSPKSWEWLFNYSKYKGDYEFLFFE